MLNIGIDNNKLTKCKLDFPLINLVPGDYFKFKSKSENCCLLISLVTPENNKNPFGLKLTYLIIVNGSEQIVYGGARLDLHVTKLNM